MLRHHKNQNQQYESAGDFAINHHAVNQHNGSILDASTSDFHHRDLVLLIFLSGLNDDEWKPVSYTHLDVYKRQI